MTVHSRHTFVQRNRVNSSPCNPAQARKFDMISLHLGPCLSLMDPELVWRMTSHDIWITFEIIFKKDLLHYHVQALSLRSVPMVSFWFVVNCATSQPSSSSSKMPLSMPPISKGLFVPTLLLLFNTKRWVFVRPRECGPSHFRNPLVKRLIW